MRQPLQVEVVAAGTDIAVSGRLDTLSCDELRTALKDAVAEGDGDLVVHAEGLEIWGSPALGVLVGASHAARRRDRRLVLSGLSARELRLLRAGHLDRFVAIAPAVTAAPGSAAGQAGARSAVPGPRETPHDPLEPLGRRPEVEPDVSSPSR